MKNTTYHRNKHYFLNFEFSSNLFFLLIFQLLILGGIIFSACVVPKISFTIKLSLGILFVIGALFMGESFKNLLYLFLLSTAMSVTVLTVPLVKGYEVAVGLNDFLVFFLFLILILHKFLKGDLRINRNFLSLPLFILLIAAFLSLLNTEDKRLGIIYLFFMLEGFIVYVYTLTFSQTDEDLKRLLFVFFIIAYFYGIYGIFQYKIGYLPFVGGVKLEKTFPESISRVRANLTHPNCLSGFIAVVLPLMYVSFKREKGIWNLWLIFSIAILIFTLGVTYSRNGYIAFLVGTFVVVVLVYIKYKKIWPLLAFTFGLPFLYFITGRFLPSILHRFISIKYFKIDIAIVQRFIFWREGIKTFLSHPLFGIGVANFIHLPYSGGLLLAHNLFITTLITMGITGFLGVVFLFYRVVKQIFITYKYTPHESMSKLSIGFLGSWAAFISHNLIDEVWTSPSHVSEMKYLWVFLAITVLFVRLSKK